MLPPSPWVLQHASLVAPGTPVLDVAAGSGRHTHLFLDRDHPVTAVDRDTSRLEPHPALRIVQADLEDGSPWPLPGERFGGIVVTNYLHRPLFSLLLDALLPGGVLIYETFAAGNERFGHPRNPDFLLRPGELEDVVRGRLRVVAYEHGEVTSPRPAVVQRIAAVTPGGSGSASRARTTPP